MPSTGRSSTTTPQRDFNSITTSSVLSLRRHGGGSMKPLENPVWNDRPHLDRPLCAYNGLRDPGLASYFARPTTRTHLVQSGTIAPDGRIVHLNRAYGRVMVAEHVFADAQKEEIDRQAREYYLRTQVMARNAASRDKMLKNTRVHQLRKEEQRLLAERRKKREELEKRILEGGGGRGGCVSSASNNKSVAKKKPTMKKKLDWETLQKIPATSTVVTRTVVPVTDPEQQYEHLEGDTPSSCSSDENTAEGKEDLEEEEEEERKNKKKKKKEHYDSGGGGDSGSEENEYSDEEFHVNEEEGDEEK